MSVKRVLRELCTDSDGFQIKHEECSGYVDYDEKEQRLECRNCHKVKYIH